MFTLFVNLQLKDRFLYFQSYYRLMYEMMNPLRLESTKVSGQQHLCRYSKNAFAPHYFLALI